MKEISHLLKISLEMYKSNYMSKEDILTTLTSKIQSKLIDLSIRFFFLGVIITSIIMALAYD